MADIFDVLADATRRELLVTLHERRVHGGPSDELTVSELVERLELSQPTVSKHLQRLREQGLVSVRTNGQHHYYRLQTAPLRELESWLSDFLGDATAAEEVVAAAEGAAVFAAWAGADVGETLGRRLADGTHQARVVVTDASSKVVRRIPRIGKRKPGELGVDTE